jgi:hypothetical protein
MQLRTGAPSGVATCEEVYCRLTHSFVDRPLTGTSIETKPTLWEMAQTAWVVHTDNTRQQVGFMGAEDCRLQQDQKRSPVQGKSSDAPGIGR